MLAHVRMHVVKGPSLWVSLVGVRKLSRYPFKSATSTLFPFPAWAGLFALRVLYIQWKRYIQLLSLVLLCISSIRRRTGAEIATEHVLFETRQYNPERQRPKRGQGEDRKKNPPVP